MAEEYPSFDLSGRSHWSPARALGWASAPALAHAGANVALGLRRKESGTAIVNAIEAMVRRALLRQMDMEHLDQSRGAVAKLMTISAASTRSSTMPVSVRKAPQWTCRKRNSTTWFGST
jgi:hypothetical protein